jgi:ABC-2 type transport system ATP-binding protein
MAAIITENLSKRYGNGVIALSGLSLSIGEGTVFGFLGPNGAGKTTTVRILNGTLAPTGGTSTILGVSSRDDEIRKRTATLSEDARMYESLSALDNLLFFGAMYDLSEKASRERGGELLKKLRLWEKRDEKMGTFSTGMKKRLHLARVLLHRPALLFLDEPTSGLDPESASEVIDLVGTLAREEGVTVFLCTHNLHQAEGICDLFGFIDAGVMIRSGTREELVRSIMGKDRVRIRTLRDSHEFEIEAPIEINGHITRLISSGETITEVMPVRPTLEEVYFAYIGRKNRAVE